MSGLPLYNKPPRKKINPIGPAAKRKWPTRAASYKIVSLRAKGHCELNGKAQDPLDPHHVFGRGHIHGIPSEICDSPELILGICRECHDEIHDGNNDLADEARTMAVDAFMARHDLWEHLVTVESFEDPLTKMRYLVRALNGEA